jgi:hypothetical protein
MRAAEDFCCFKGHFTIVGDLWEKKCPKLDANDWKEIGILSLRVMAWRNQYPTLGH